MIADARPILITGGAGFIGCNIADRLAGEGHDILVYDALARDGVGRNLAWLQARHPGKIATLIADIRDEDMLAGAVAEAKAVFHMAAQVAVTTSLIDPRDDFEINVGGTLNLLEALRREAPETPLIFASTNKVYGDLGDLDLEPGVHGYRPADERVRRVGIGEDRPLDFHTPYGCSKGAADQYMLDYARSFGLPAAVLRMSCIYGIRQMGTEDQGWVAHFLIRALEGRPLTVYGDGQQVRDILDISDAVNAYLAAWQNIGRIKGRAFNLGGGPDNAVSLRQLIAHVGYLLGHDVEITFSDWRAGDQRYFVADTSEIDATFGLPSKTPWKRGVETLGRWLAAERHIAWPAAAASLAVAGAR